MLWYAVGPKEMRWLATCESCAKSCGRGCGIRITLFDFVDDDCTFCLTDVNFFYLSPAIFGSHEAH